MPESDSPPDADPGSGDSGQPRKWEKPRIESGQLFETASLACGKTPAIMTAQCQMQNPSNS